MVTVSGWTSKVAESGSDDKCQRIGLSDGDQKGMRLDRG